MILGDIGVVVLAPAGRTTLLGVELAVEIAERNRPVWLLTDASHSAELPELPTLRLTMLPSVCEAVSPLATTVPLQLLAVRAAKARGRVPGSLMLVSKVTERE
jgi:glucosamine 6-phosphate synthetase-like amidotransferase/phosphosugar isomerase protein